MSRVPVAILGATGVAGAQALRALNEHPWFEVGAVASSSRNAGRRLSDALEDRGQSGRRLAGALADAVLDLELADARTLDVRGHAVVFSMLPAEVARIIEARCAATTPVFSTAAAFRDEPDTPLLLAGVNPDHAAMLEGQRAARGWGGFVAPGPNCTTVGLAVTVAPLRAAFGVRAVSFTSMQAVSGAGSDAARVADAVTDNLLPFIRNEEQKVDRESRKILGTLADGGIEPATFTVSGTCTRVAVNDGHTLSVAVALERRGTPAQAVAALRATDPWRGRELPSRPERWIEVRDEEDRPQPRLDRDAGGGFTTVVGRVREDPVLGGVKYVVVSHNTVIGAAGGAVLLAEDLFDRGFLSTAP